MLIRSTFKWRPLSPLFPAHLSSKPKRLSPNPNCTPHPIPAISSLQKKTFLAMKRKFKEDNSPSALNHGQRTGKSSDHQLERHHQNQYQYCPLDPAQESIRLLRLYPSKTNDKDSPIHCSLFHTTLSSAPPYIALSYAWGDRSGSYPILVGKDEEIVDVTPNLLHALERLRGGIGEGGEMVLWIDAVCINQKDIPERNIQTAEMRMIYMRAESVSVWLGLESGDSRGAIQLAKELNLCSAGPGGDEERRALVSEEKREVLEALVLLFRRQYWWRIWVIQEVSCAKKATVYCGDEEISWTDLDNVCDVLKGEESHLLDLWFKRPSFIRTLTHGGPRGLQLSRYSPNLDDPPLLELLLSHKSKKSTDPKDKVFALVGISNSRNSFGAIDYSLPVRDIYTNTARHIISTSNKLDVICVKQHDKPQFNLPSWVTDWTRPPPNLSSQVIGLHHHEPPFAAAGTSLAEFEFVDDGYVLQASGFILDTISTAGVPFKQKGAPNDVAPALRVFHDWFDLYTSFFPDSSSLSAKAAFCRTISCGNWMHDDDESVYEEKIRAIFDLSELVLAGDIVLEDDTPSPPPTSLPSSLTSSMESTETYEMEDIGDKEQVSLFINTTMTMNRRRLFISMGGIVGLAPWDTDAGDRVCILLGCRFPVILREVEGCWFVVGECYVDGFMDGEGMLGLEEGKYALKTFKIN